MTCQCRCATSSCLRKQMALYDEIRALKTSNHEELQHLARRVESCIRIAEHLTSGNAAHVRGNLTLLLGVVRDDLSKMIDKK